MKKTLFALASIAMLMPSCTKEFIAPAESQGELFTCTIESETKTAIDSTGCPVWEAGDFIILYNGSKATTATLTEQTTIKVQENSAQKPFFVGDEAVTNNIIEKIVITSDMISEDGKTVSFKKTIDDAADSYYAVAESKGAALIYAINAPGTVTFREANNHTDADRKVVHVAVAKCSKDSRNFSFKNAFCQVKFSLPENKYSKVTFEANSGSANTFVCGMSSVKFDGTSWGTAQSKTAVPCYNITLSKTSGAAPYYVPVASTAVLDKGITIKCYTSDSDESPLTISTKKSFPIARNRTINLGNLEETTPITSYYEAYQAGKNIKIGGVQYNKSMGLNATLIEADIKLSGDCKGLFFVKEGVSLKVEDGTAKPTADFIALCDKPGAKAKVVVSDMMRIGTSGIKYIFSNMEFNFTTKNSITYGSSEVGKFGLYNCKIVNSTYLTLSSSSKIKNIELEGCDFATSVSFGLIPGNIDVKTDNVIIRNCQFYSTTGNSLEFKFCTKKVTEGVVSTMGNVVIENNTFYNISWTQANYHGMVNPNSVDSFVFKKNLFSFANVNSNYHRVLYLSCDNDTFTAGYPATGEASDNIAYNDSKRHFVCYNASSRLNWYSTSYKEFTYLTENPFTSVDTSTGTFTKASAYASYGAQR